MPLTTDSSPWSFAHLRRESAAVRQPAVHREQQRRGMHVYRHRVALRASVTETAPLVESPSRASRHSATMQDMSKENATLRRARGPRLRFGRPCGRGIRREPPPPSARSAEPSQQSTGSVSCGRRTEPSRRVDRPRSGRSCAGRALLVVPHRVATRARRGRARRAHAEGARPQGDQEPAGRGERETATRARADEAGARQGQHGHRRPAEGHHLVGKRAGTDGGGLRTGAGTVPAPSPGHQARPEAVMQASPWPGSTCRPCTRSRSRIATNRREVLLCKFTRPLSRAR